MENSGVEPGAEPPCGSQTQRRRPRGRRGSRKPQDSKAPGAPKHGSDVSTTASDRHSKERGETRKRNQQRGDETQKRPQKRDAKNSDQEPPQRRPNKRTNNRRRRPNGKGGQHPSQAEMSNKVQLQTLNDAALRANAPEWCPGSGLQTYALKVGIPQTEEEDRSSQNNPPPVAPQGFSRLQLGSIQTRGAANSFLRRARAKEEAAASLLQLDRIRAEISREDATAIVDTLLQDAIEEHARDVARQWAGRLRERWRQYFAKEGFQELEPAVPAPRKKTRTLVQDGTSTLAPEGVGSVEGNSMHINSEPNIRIEKTARGNNADLEKTQVRVDQDVKLLDACERGDLNEVLQWANSVRQNGDLVPTRLHGICREDGWGPLALAVEARAAGVVEMLVSWNADSSVRAYAAGVGKEREDERCSLLHHICHVGDVLVLEGALRAGAGGSHAISYGLNLEAKDSRGRTPLHICAARADMTATRLLLDYGASLASKDKNGNIPLHLAVRANPSAAYMSILRPRIDAKNRDGETPLHLAAAAGANSAVAELIVRGADAHAVDKSYWTPMCKAAAGNHASTVGLLLDRGTPWRGAGPQSIQHTTVSCTPCPLHLAALHGASEVVREFVTREDTSCLEWVDWSWPCDTVLISALRGGHMELANEILNMGASPQRLNGKEESALVVALEQSKGPPSLDLLKRLVCKTSLTQNSPAVLDVAISALNQAIHISAEGEVNRVNRAFEALDFLLSLEEPFAPITSRFRARASQLIHFVCESAFERSSTNTAPVEDITKIACVLENRSDHLTNRMQEASLSKSNLDYFFRSDLQDLFENRDLMGADVTFLLENGERMHAHKDILTARCPMFAGMFRGGMLESQLLEVNMFLHSKRAIIDALRFVYYGSLDGSDLMEFASHRDFEHFVDGRVVLDYVEHAVNVLVLANEWLLHGLESIACDVIQLLLERHVLTSRGAARRKGIPRIRSAHIEDLLQFALEGISNSTLVEICSNIISLLRKLKKKTNRQQIEPPPPRCVLPHGHNFQCPCPRGILEKHHLRYCRRSDGVVVDVARMLAAANVDSASVFALAPTRLRRQIEMEGTRFDARLASDHVERTHEAEMQVLEDLDMTVFDKVLAAVEIDEFEARFTSLAELPHLGTDLMTLLSTSELFDVKIALGISGMTSGYISGHSFILKCRSPTLSRALGNFSGNATITALAFTKVVSRQVWEAIMSFIYAGFIDSRHFPRCTADAVAIAQLAEDLELVGFSHALQTVLDEHGLATIGTDGVEENTTLNMLLESSFHPSLWELEAQFRCDLLEVKEDAELAPTLGEHIAKHYAAKLPRTHACASLALRGLAVHIFGS